MSDYEFLDGGAGAVRFLVSYLEVLKEEDPVKHEKICAKQREIMVGITPNSGAAPMIIEVIVDVLKQADEKRFYQVANTVENADDK